MTSEHLQVTILSIVTTNFRHFDHTPKKLLYLLNFSFPPLSQSLLCSVFAVTSHSWNVPFESSFPVGLQKVSYLCLSISEKACLSHSLVEDWRFKHCPSKHFGNSTSLAGVHPLFLSAQGWGFHWKDSFRLAVRPMRWVLLCTEKARKRGLLRRGPQIDRGSHSGHLAQQLDIYHSDFCFSAGHLCCFLSGIFPISHEF